MNLLDLYEGREPYQQAIDKLEQSRIDHLKEKMDYYAKHGMVEQFRKAKQEHDSYFKVQDECMGYGGVVGEAGIGQDIANKTEKMARATPSTPTSKVASTVKQAAKWLAGKGGPGKEGPTYEDQDQKKNSKDPKLARLKTRARHEHPQAATDDEALALHILDKEQSDVDQLSRENDREDRIIEKLVDIEQKLQQQISQLSQQQTLDEEQKEFLYTVECDGYNKGNFVNKNDAIFSAQYMIYYGEKEYNEIKVIELKTGDVIWEWHGEKVDNDVAPTEIEVDEGWSDRIVAQRTGRPRTPYSVYIKGKKWRDFENDDHAEAVANKLRAKFKAEGRDPSVITIAPTDYDKGVAEAEKELPQWKKDWYAKQKPNSWPKHPQPYHNPNWIDELSPEDLAALTGRKVKEDEEDDWYDEEESELQNGSYVVDTQDTTGEVYRVSQYEPGARRCWIGDRDGRGWYISPDRLEIVDDTARINRYFGKKRDLDEDQDTSGVESAIIRRIMVAHTDLLQQFGPEKVMQAAEDVAYNVGDVDEIGTSDISAYVNQVKQILGAV